MKDWNDLEYSYREPERKEKEIDWEERRYETSKAMLAAFMSNSSEAVYKYDVEKQVEDALRYTDALLEKLKNDKTVTR